MMARTQISLPREVLKKAKGKAAQLGVSFAEYVRRLLARDLEEPRRRCDPSLVFDLGGGEPTDIARDKDEMIGDAIYEDYEQSTKRRG